MEWRKLSEHSMTKYWAFGISSPKDSNAYQWHFTESCDTLEQAVEAINFRRKNEIVLTAWVKDDANELCYHESYVDVLGDVNSQ